ncbi:MAG: cation-translocating P-type ATPase C-terminal domain-containing protein, partial [Clostridia bacterium]
YILQLRRQNGRSTAVSASRIGQLPLMKEADATFVPRKGSNDTLLHSCDVQMINESFETIFETLKTARLVLKRIATTSEYLLVGFFTMIFWSIFSMSLGMGMPIRIQDAFVFGIVINLIYSFSLAFSPMNRNILTEPPPRVGTKFFTSSLITPILYSLISAILCIVSHKITINTFPESAITSSLVTYSLLLFFYTFMSGSKRSVLLNRAYSNYMALLTFFVSCVITGLIFYIPKAAAFFKYAPLSVLQLAVSIGLALMFFLTAQCVMMFIEIKKTKKERIK